LIINHLYVIIFSLKGWFMSLSEKLSGLKEFGAKIGHFPDTLDTPAKRKAARMLYDIGLIALGIIALSAVSGGFNPSNFLDPGITSLMGLPMFVGISAAGAAWFLKEILPKEWHHTASKVMMFLVPALLIAGTICMCGATFHHVVGPNSITSVSLLGAVLVPAAIGSIGYSASSLKDNISYFFPRRVQKPQDDVGLIPEVSDSETERSKERSEEFELGNLSDEDISLD
jgi:hypothetical protein